MKSTTLNILFILHFCKSGLTMRNTNSRISKNGHSTTQGGSTGVIPNEPLSTISDKQEMTSGLHVTATGSGFDKNTPSGTIDTTNVKPTSSDKQEMTSGLHVTATGSGFDKNTPSSSIETTNVKPTSPVQNVNLEFVNETLTWIDAIKRCKNSGLIMASNETAVKNWLNENDVGEQVWLGKYDELTEWAYIKGCYDIELDLKITTTKIKMEERLLCQKLCKDYKFFGVKIDVCICLEDVKKYNSLNCTHFDSVTIWEHQLEDYDPDKYYDDEALCIVATRCDIGNIERKYDDCNLDYRIICDNGQHISYTGDNQGNALSRCSEMGSFIKWYNKGNCWSEEKKSLRHWTSGRRERLLVYLSKYDQIDERRLLQCFSIDVDSVYDHKMATCKETKRKFLCREENSNDRIEPVRPVTIKTNEQKQSSSAGVAVGVVIAVFVILSAITILVILIKRRKYQEDTTTPLSSKSVTVSNSKYKLQKPRSGNNNDTHIIDNSCHSTAVTSSNKNIAANYSLAKPKEDNRDHVHFSLAQPTEVDSDYVYSSDYDHLNSPLKQNVDSDYSISCQMNITDNDKVGTYDHFRPFERKEDSGGSSSNYDHLPTNIGIDPTYDVSGRMVHDDSDKYDHLPLNFKHGTTNDYQSTNDILAGDTTDNYDHFVRKQSKPI